MSKKGKQALINNPKVVDLVNHPSFQRWFALTSILSQRGEIAERLGKSFGGDRDLYTALGYAKTPDFKTFYARYRRQDIAKKIVNAPADATWRGIPDVVERGVTKKKDNEDTPFEKAWKDLHKRLKLYHYFGRADRLAGIGEYGILFLGFGGEEPLEMPVQYKNNNQLLYVQPYTQDSATVHSIEENPRNPNFGKPLIYNINMSSGSFRRSYLVHASRVIHIAEDLEEGEIYGTPRLEAVLDRLYDLVKVVGGSGEMFWEGAFPGYVFSADPMAKIGAQALADLEEELQEYIHDFRRFIRVQGFNVTDMKPQAISPKDHVDVQVMMISAASNIPQRILVGSEQGRLAAEQDDKHWRDHIDERRTDFAGPNIHDALINRCIDVGALPVPKEGFDTIWPSQHAPSDEQKAIVAEKRTNALSKYVQSGLDAQMSFSSYLRTVMQFTQDEIDQIIDEMPEMDKHLEEPTALDRIPDEEEEK